MFFRIAGHNLPIPASKVHKVFSEAWKLWSNVAPIKFRKRKRREADIVISFHNGGELERNPVRLYWTVILTLTLGINLLNITINCFLQTIRTAHLLMAKEEFWLMPLCLGMVLVEMCTLMLMKTGALILLVRELEISYNKHYNKPTVELCLYTEY